MIDVAFLCAAERIPDLSHGTYVLARVAAHMLAYTHVFARETEREREPNLSSQPRQPSPTSHLSELSACKCDRYSHSVSSGTS